MFPGHLSVNSHLSIVNNLSNMKVHIYSFAFFAFLAVAHALKECPEIDGHYAVSVANPADCSSFYACSSGRPVLTNCPTGLEYNEALGVCDWAGDADCVVAQTSNPSA